MNDTWTQKILNHLKRWDRGVCPGGQILIEQSGETLIHQGLGYANLELQVPINTETIFHIASVSKQFTVMALLLLEQEGKLRLDDPIADYLPESFSGSKLLQDRKHPIRLRNLCNNTSGLRDIWELIPFHGYLMCDNIRMEDVNTVMRGQVARNFYPGEQYLYCNPGFQLLAIVVERLSGEPFADFVKNHLLEPLGMHHSCIRTNSHQLIPNLAYSYLDEGEEYFYYPLNYFMNGPTSVNTCASDLIKVIGEYESPSLLSKESVQFMLTPASLKNGETVEYCGGLMRHELLGSPVFEHGGADAGYRSYFFWMPEHELKIILLSNTNTYLMQQKAHEIATTVLQSSPSVHSFVGADQKTSTETATEALPARAGCYVGESKGTPRLVEIVEKAGCFMQKRELTETCLHREASGIYRVGHLDETLRFTAEGLEFSSPSETVLLRRTEPLASGTIPCGRYRLIDDCPYTFELFEDNGEIHIRLFRYGETPVYDYGEGNGIFTFGPEFTLSITAKEESIEFNGYRIKKVEAVRLEEAAEA